MTTGISGQFLIPGLNDGRPVQLKMLDEFAGSKLDKHGLIDIAHFKEQMAARAAVELLKAKGQVELI